MRYRCAWCKVELSQLYPDGEGERVSDGICLPCVAKHFPDEYEAVAERYAGMVG